jgi:hypothetical protein
MATTKSSAELEREVTEQRSRVEERIGEIRERLSPGQLLDEALSYTKHGGANFATGLAQQVSANPLPSALVGIGLAWLMASSGNSTGAPVPQSDWRRDDDAPYGRLPSGGLKRVSHSPDEEGQWWSEFATDAGDSYRAKASETGERASHFVDKAGRRVSGFVDDAGNRVRQFQDEAGNRLDDALGWANHNWSTAQSGVANAMTGARQLGDQLVHGTGDLAGTVRAQGDQLGRQAIDLFNRQPLVAGALAFAAGAAIGALLPTTEQEDVLLGEQADKVKEQAAETAADLYEKGKATVAEAYESASNSGAKIYESAKDELGVNSAGSVIAAAIPAGAAAVSGPTG